MSLQDLPVETIVRILSFLDWQDLLSTSQLNHLFRDVYQNNSELQYSFALQVSGMVDNDSSVDLRQKLNEIERKERAWRTMDLTRKVTVKVPHRTSHIYDLSGGVYLLGDCKQSVVTRDTHSLRFFDLDTCNSGPVLRSEPWPEMNLDASIVDIGFGLREFDLVAIVGIKHGEHGEPSEIILSLRELSTGAPHPLARNPDIVVDRLSNTQGKLSIMMEIVGPSLLLLLSWHQNLQRFSHHYQDRLVLFNWWDGTKVAAETTPEDKWDGFVFLSPELVLLPCRERGLEVIRLPDVTKGFSSKGFERILRLTLPIRQPLVKVGAIQSRSEPNPFGPPHPNMVKGKTEFLERMRTKKRPPVAPDPMKSVVLLQIYYREFQNDPNDLLMGQWAIMRHNVSLIVHRERLVRLIASKTQSFPSPSSLSSAASSSRPNSDGSARMDAEENIVMENDPDVPIVPWAEWHSHARWMADDTHVSNWITTTAGQRYIGTDEEGHIVIRDFNPITVQRARAAAATIGDSKNIYNDYEDAMMAATLDEFRNPFSNDVVMEGSNGEAEVWEDDGLRSRANYRIWNLPVGNASDSDSDSELGSEEGGEEDTPLVEETDEALLESLMSYDENTSDASGSTTVDSASQYASARSTFSGSSTNTSPISPSHLFNSSTHKDITKGQEEQDRIVEEDSTWKAVRVIEGYNEIEKLELQKLFFEDCRWPMPCVEYVSRNTYDHHGLLMDEERIIGLRHDEHTGAIVEFDVFTL